MALTALIGQHKLKTILAGEARHRHAGTYILTGAKGMGRHSFAEEFAKALMCEAPNDDGACGKCNCCNYFEGGTTPDIVRVDAPSDGKMIPVADVREKIVADSVVKPQFSRNKVFIINMDYVAEAGQNALLKSIEEPPANVAFILLSSLSGNVLDTVLSRSEVLKISRYTEEEVYDVLKLREAPGDEDTLRTICSYCGGNPGRALAMTSDDSYISLNREVTDLLLGLGSDSYTDILTDGSAFFADNKKDADLIIEIMFKVLGDILMYNVYPDREAATETAAKIRKFALENRHINSVAIGRCKAAVTEFVKMISVNTNYDGACCALMIKIHEEFKR